MTGKPPPKRSDLPKRFLDHLRAVTGKRSRIVIEHILQHGHITTEELSEEYGYGHPPRAARDVREQGVPLETFFVQGQDGRRIAAYRFGNPKDAESRKLGGRGTWPKGLKDELIEESRSRCAVCAAAYSPQELQIDHCVPYEVGGDQEEGRGGTDHVMLLCGSCNRAKSWTCEHCDNLTGLRDPELCKTCYWGNPEKHEHVALRAIRRTDLVWTGEEVRHFDLISRLATEVGERVPDFIKGVVREAVPDEEDTDA